MLLMVSDNFFYRVLFSSAEMHEIWCSRSLLAGWLRAEQSLACAQAAVGLIPVTAAEALAALRVEDLDREALVNEMMLVGRPIVGLVRQLRARLGQDGRHVHYLSTTQDIMDTGLCLQLRRAVDDLAEVAERVLIELERHAANAGQTQMIGRTNGQHALPIRVATKFLLWRDEIVRRRKAISAAARSALLVQLGGPVGNLAGYPDRLGQKVRELIAEDLGLSTAETQWQNARDSLANLVLAVGGLCGTICKIAANVNLLSSTEIAEMAECHEPGRGASSAMEHKRNQRNSEFAEALGRLGRQRAEQIGEATLHLHERSGGAWIMEWLIVPETFLLASGALFWTEQMFRNLQVNLGQMQHRADAAVAAAASVSRHTD